MTNGAAIPWMIYGASGYTGKLIAAEATRRGHQPILAGRSPARLQALATELNCPVRAFGLDDCQTQLSDVRLVLNCAGPFSQTARPLIDACLARGVHYLDITGEIDVIEHAASLNLSACNAGIVLMPSVGFDVVPTDCLAALVARELPTSTHLELAFAGSGPLSPGTAKTMWENLSRGGRVRRDGKIVSVPAAWKTKTIDFSDRARFAMTIPWGDVASAFHTTGIPNIEVYAAAPRNVASFAKAGRWLWQLTAWRPLAALGRRLIDTLVPGPSKKQLAASRAWLWAKATDATGRVAEATLDTPGGYRLTVITGLDSVEKVLATPGLRGFHTPSQVMGAEYILTVDETKLAWRTRPQNEA